MIGIPPQGREEQAVDLQGNLAPMNPENRLLDFLKAMGGQAEGIANVFIAVFE